MTESTAPEICVSCRLPKAQTECGVCFDALCRTCAIFLDEATFAFKSNLPDELKQTYYCQGCHELHVEPALKSYQELLATAKGVFFFFETHKKNIPYLKKSRFDVKVSACADRNETILRLGFMAAEQGFNAILGAVVTCEKIRLGAYQTSKWSGHGTPATVDSVRLEKHFQIED